MKKLTANILGIAMAQMACGQVATAIPPTYDSGMEVAVTQMAHSGGYGRSYQPVPEYGMLLAPGSGMAPVLPYSSVAGDHPLSPSVEPGFRVLLNGIECVSCSDGATNDCEIYVDVYADGARVATWGKRSMNLDGVPRDWWTQFVGAFTPNTLSYSKKQFWLAPGCVWAQNSVTFKLWEQDEGGQSNNAFRDNDDFIGEVTYTASSPNGNFLKTTFNESGSWNLVCSKHVRGSIVPDLEGKSALVPVRVPILNQGDVGACTAFSTIAAVTSIYLNKVKPGTSREDLFNPLNLYNRRPNQTSEGMAIESALAILKNEGIAFKNDPSKVLKITGYRYITDRNEMRRALGNGKPLLAQYDVYADFGAYAGEQGVYGGNVTSNHVKNANGTNASHAVVVVGYENPALGDNPYPLWIMQNSWGAEWGNNGLCKFAEGACGFDNRMYVIDDVVVVGGSGNPSDCSSINCLEFNAEYYANTYPDLKAAFGYDCQKLKDHWLTSGKKEGRHTAPNFSIQAYLARYEDLQKAFGAQNYEAAWKHWYDSGKREGRNPNGCVGISTAEFDAIYYADKYPDLKAAFGYDCQKLKDHWMNFGKKEGRQTAANFNIQAYLARYEDLRNAFGAQNYTSAWQHWYDFGKKEGRTAAPLSKSESAKPAPVKGVDCSSVNTQEFDAVFYANTHPDLKAAFGYDCQKLKDHWMNSGKKEGRQTAPGFSIKAYLARYEDLRNAFGATNYTSAWQHWYDFGKKEGRSAAP